MGQDLLAEARRASAEDGALPACGRIRMGEAPGRAMHRPMPAPRRARIRVRVRHVHDGAVRAGAQDACIGGACRGGHGGHRRERERAREHAQDHQTLR